MLMGSGGARYRPSWARFDSVCQSNEFGTSDRVALHHYVELGSILGIVLWKFSCFKTDNNSLKVASESE